MALPDQRRAYEESTMNRQPKYTISVVAEIVGLHEQSLRLYERRGLIQPQRSEGNIRLFSDEDVERVRTIKRLMNDLGVNLAGAEVILHMREQMDEMQRELEFLRKSLRELTQREFE
jgi:MerR family transcriptional regulator, heat shock protein HspR